MKGLVGLCLSLVFSISVAAAGEFPLGEVVERVACENNPEQSYALYLPSNYDASRTWPAVYAFDPAARGSLPVKLLVPVAEKFGYVIVGSNNSRNGPFSGAYAAATAMFEDTFGRFSVNGNRIYMTGFSGGGRVISQLAVMAQNISGIIACGAGLHPNVPPGKFKFPYVGIVGNGDMNYREMHDLHDTLTRDFETPNRLFVFNGGHQWPPQESLERALVWLELELVRSGKQAANQTFLEEAFSRELTLAQGAEDQGEYFEAYQAFSNLEEDFAGLVDVGSVHKTSLRLAKLPAVKNGLRNQAKIRDQEHRELEKYTLYLQQVAGGRAQSLGWWRKRIDRLLKKRDEAKDAQSRLLWARMYDILWRSAIESSWLREEPDVAVRYARIAAVANPSSPYIHFSLGRAESRAGNSDAAVGALGKAIDLGLTRASLLKDDPSFDSLGDLDSFKKLISRLDSTVACP